MDHDGTKVGIVTVIELSEDEFWFFHGFRPALFNLQADLPAFFYEMTIVNVHAVFESYLTNLLRTRLRQHPRIMGSQHQLRYEDVFAASSKDDILGGMIEREIRDLMYLPFPGLMQKMRDKLGFGTLTHKYDEAAYYWSLVRNCVLHNHGKVDRKLAQAKPDLTENAKIVLNENNVREIIFNVRYLAYEMDKIFERSSAPQTEGPPV